MTPTTIKKTRLIEPYGGNALKNLLVASPEEAEDLKNRAASLASIQLSARLVCDLEMLATGAFSPLAGFMGEADYRRVLAEMRLTESDLIFPIPITLPVSRESGIRENQEIALRDAKNNLLALMTVEEIYAWEKAEFAASVLGTNDARHSLVAEMSGWGNLHISGKLRVLALPRYYDFPELRFSPAKVRERLEALGNENVTAFQTRNPLHRAHEEMTRKAQEKIGGTLLMHPVVGLTRAGDVDYYSRVRTYKILTEKYYERSSTLLALLPLAMRFAGPREALWHAVIRRNYGANHLIVGRDHAGAGVDASGKPFYAPHAARELVEKFSAETGVGVVPFEEFVYLPESGVYEESSKLAPAKKYFSLSGTQVREDYLNKGRRLPEWFTRPEVARILEESYPLRRLQGVCLWFTGLSGAGKSTTAEILTAMLSAHNRRVTLLDGDVVRTHLSAGLGFDKQGRNANVRRIGFVASEITHHGGVAVCAAISPYQSTRSEVREMVGENFIEIYVDAPLDVCERRDTKGMYARARRGEIKNFTGIDDAYEKPLAPEITLDAVNQTAEENARLILDYLIEKGFVQHDEAEARPC